jgi:hypothetical protein
VKTAILALLVVARAHPAAADVEGGVVGIITSAHRPVPHATLRFVAEGRDPVYVDSDADGRYRVTLAAGAWTLSATARDRLPEATSVEVVAGRDVAADVQLGAESAGLEAIEGTVTSERGPVAGARIDALNTSQFQTTHAVATTTTDSNGHYRLVVGVPSRYVHTIAVVARAAGFGPADRDVQTGWDKTADLEMHAGGTIRGEIIAVDGGRSSDTTVALTRKSRLRLDDAGPTRTITANEDGTFAIGDLPPSSYELSVGTAPPVVVVLGAGEHVDVRVTAPRKPRR